MEMSTDRIHRCENFSTSRKAADLISGEHGLRPKNAPLQLYFSKHGIRTISSYREQQFTTASTQAGGALFGCRLLKLRFGPGVVVEVAVVCGIIEVTIGNEKNFCWDFCFAMKTSNIVVTTYFSSHLFFQINTTSEQNIKKCMHINYIKAEQALKAFVRMKKYVSFFCI